jgi:hypothetical protein
MRFKYDDGNNDKLRETPEGVWLGNDADPPYNNILIDKVETVKYFIFIGNNLWNEEGKFEGENGAEAIYDYWPGSESLIPLDSSLGFVNSNNLFTMLVEMMRTIEREGKESSLSKGYMIFPQAAEVIKAQNDKTVSENAWNHVYERGKDNKGKGFDEYSGPNDDNVLDDFLLPQDSEVYTDNKFIEIKDLFQRNSLISILYLRIYLDFLSES